jgi:hypothetical protein
MPVAHARAWIAVALLPLALLGCPPEEAPKHDAGAPARSGAPTARPAPSETPSLAVNDFEITRYADERPINHILGSTHVAESDARTQAGAALGTVVARLPPNTPVDQIAERPGWVLVVFIDPRDPSDTRRVMGWVPYADFVPPAAHRADAGPATPPPQPRPARPLDVKQEGGECPAGYSPCGAMCRLQCRFEGDCVAPGARCVGGYCLAPNAMPCAR